MTELNIGCGSFYAEGWTNVDAVRNEWVSPDVVGNPANAPLPFPDGSVTRIYLGHVLEHQPEHLLPTFFAEIKRLLAPGAQVLAVGPDIFKCLDLWKKDERGMERVIGTMEGPNDANWPEGRHYWNCHQERLEGFFREAGFQVQALPIEPNSFIGWPCVDPTAQDQSALLAWL